MHEEEDCITKKFLTLALQWLCAKWWLLGALCELRRFGRFSWFQSFVISIFTIVSKPPPPESFPVCHTWSSLVSTVRDAFVLL